MQYIIAAEPAEQISLPMQYIIAAEPAEQISYSYSIS